MILESRGIMDEVFTFRLSISVSFKSLILKLSPVNRSKVSS